MKKFAMFVVTASLLAACGSDHCEKATDAINAKLEECGVEIPDVDPVDDAVEVVCTEDLEEQLECQQACIEAAPCDVIDGTTDDADAVADYIQCNADCATGGDDTDEDTDEDTDTE